MSEFDLSQSIQILSNTPAVLTMMLSNVPEEWLAGNEGGDSWSPFDIVGHLIHGERTDWIPRARIILQHGKNKAFTPFDRFAQFKDSKGKNIADLLAEFAALRRENLNTLEAMNLSGADFRKEGIHPDFGVVTLRQLIATWVVHDLGHLRQIARVMAKNYRDEIGPWRRYLPVVDE